jgi:hypothetical protein
VFQVSGEADDPYSLTVDYIQDESLLVTCKSFFSEVNPSQICLVGMVLFAAVRVQWMFEIKEGAGCRSRPSRQCHVGSNASEFHCTVQRIFQF